MQFAFEPVDALELFFVGTAPQLVIPKPHIPWIGQWGGILLLRYSRIWFIGLTILIKDGRGVPN